MQPTRSVAVRRGVSCRVDDDGRSHVGLRFVCRRHHGRERGLGRDADGASAVYVSGSRLALSLL